MGGKIELAAKLPVIFFEERDKIVAYSPALNLSTFGKTEDQARKRFVEAAVIFLEELARMGTIDEVLEESGWRCISYLAVCT